MFPIPPFLKGVPARRGILGKGEEIPPASGVLPLGKGEVKHMNYLFYIIIFILGSAIGSFLNVVICRLETGEGIIKKRSHCVKCGQTLTWYELIPIISFLCLRGRCRSCREKISWQYPLVEIVTGLLFIAVTTSIFPELVEGSKMVLDFTSFRSNNIIPLFYLLYVTCSLIVIFVYDLRHYIIPDKILFPAIGVALIYQLFLAFDFASLRSGNNIAQSFSMNLFPELVEGFKIFYPYLLSTLGASAFFLAIILITRGKGMGLGDAKLAFLMGLVLGWPNILAALFLAFFMGATVGVGLIFLGRKTMKSQIPFGPFLIAGTMIMLFWGQGILNWYFGLLG